MLNVPHEVIFKESISLVILDDREKCLFKRVEEGDLSGLKRRSIKKLLLIIK